MSAETDRAATSARRRFPGSWLSGLGHGSGRQTRNHNMITQEAAVNAGITKVCGKCKQEKASTHFTADKSKKFGLGCYCKQCNVQKSREWHIKNRERKNAYGVQYNKNNPEVGKRNNKRWMEKDPNRQRAQNAVKREIRKGSIVRPSACSKCNQPGFVEAHHDSYAPDKWLDVVFLCRSCHKRLHAENPHITR